MDIDVIHRQVQGLVKFRTAVEAFLANAGHDIGAEASDHSIGDRVTELETRFAGLAPSDDTTTASRLTALEEIVTGIQKALDELGPKLADLPALLEGVSALKDLADNKDRLLAAADWVDQNKEQVAALVQIGDDLAGTASDAAGAAAGAASVTGGTNPAPDATATGAAS